MVTDLQHVTELPDELPLLIIHLQSPQFRPSICCHLVDSLSVLQCESQHHIGRIPLSGNIARHIAYGELQVLQQLAPKWQKLGR